MNNIELEEKVIKGVEASRSIIRTYIDDNMALNILSDEMACAIYIGTKLICKPCGVHCNNDSDINIVELVYTFDNNENLFSIMIDCNQDSNKAVKILHNGSDIDTDNLADDIILIYHKILAIALTVLYTYSWHYD